MRLLSIILIVLANIAWIYICLALGWDNQALNTLVQRFGFTTEVSLQKAIPYALLLAFISQLILLALIYFMNASRTLLSSKYRETRTKNKELENRRKEMETELKGRKKQLEETSGVQERADVLEEQLQEMQDLSKELSDHNHQLLNKNEELSKLADSLQKKLTSGGKASGGSFTSWITGLFSKK